MGQRVGVAIAEGERFHQHRAHLRVLDEAAVGNELAHRGQALAGARLDVAQLGGGGGVRVGHGGSPSGVDAQPGARLERARTGEPRSHRRSDAVNPERRLESRPFGGPTRRAGLREPHTMDTRTSPVPPSPRTVREALQRHGARRRARAVERPAPVRVPARALAGARSGCRASPARWARWSSRARRRRCSPTAATGRRPRPSSPAAASSW